MTTVLFISRAHPPAEGGIENQNRDLSVWLRKLVEVRTIVNRRGRKYLPIFLPYALVRSFTVLPSCDAVLLGDGLLMIVGWCVKLFSRKPVLCIVHGLDLTYPGRLYQALWVGVFARSVDRFIAVGNDTVQVAYEKRIPAGRVVFIPNGIEVDQFGGPHSRRELAAIVGMPLDGKHVILSSGRLVKRKGIAWFIEHVLPKLRDEVLYVIAGRGPDQPHIEAAIRNAGPASRVKLLGYVSDEVRNTLMATADLFVQPNIPVPGDIEGFGLVVLEAAASGLTVVASRLEGLKDSVTDGESGFLIEPYDASGYAKKVNELLSDEAGRRAFGQKARRFVAERYSWEIMAHRYHAEIEALIRRRQASGA